MKRTNKKECPKCHSKKILKTRSGIGSYKGNGLYTYNPLSEVFYECKNCHEWFSYKKRK